MDRAVYKTMGGSFGRNITCRQGKSITTRNIYSVRTKCLLHRGSGPMCQTTSWSSQRMVSCLGFSVGLYHHGHFLYVHFCIVTRVETICVWAASLSNLLYCLWGLLRHDDIYTTPLLFDNGLLLCTSCFMTW
jgi:hypothetical protein